MGEIRYIYSGNKEPGEFADENSRAAESGELPQMQETPAETGESVPVQQVTEMKPSFYIKPEIDEVYKKNTVDILIRRKIDAILAEQGITGKIYLEEVEKRKNTIAPIFAIIQFLLISICFFRISFIFTPLIFLNIILCAILYFNYDPKDYMVKQIKARQDEKIHYIVSSIVASRVEPQDSKVRKRKAVRLLMVAFSILVPMLVFQKPHLLYEKTEDGNYYVRFYTSAIQGETVVEIPENHKNGKVVGIRGDVFKKCTKIEEVKLPASMQVIRGNAFEGCESLKKINLPEGLAYIGGGAFQRCYDLTEIDIPDSVTELHGEAFMECYSLARVKLPANITEIRGNTFENCTNLAEIEIPEGVTRIGGHAFYGCYHLKKVTVPDSLEEIGSSAFRKCNALKSIEIPDKTYVNERSFKESPTVVERRATR